MISSMLPLDDNRWGQLTTFFGKPEFIPNILEEWLRSVGHDEEDIVYYHDLFDLFLHQATITNAAFAVVPWLVHVSKRSDTRLRIEYLTDVALVEANRLTYGVHFNREGTEPYPEWLMSDYQHALIDARHLVEETIENEHDTERKRGLIALKPALYGNADLAWSQW